VHIVQTRKTLKENNLAVVEDIVPISARLIANKASFQFKNQPIEQIVASLSAQCSAQA
jgi:ATP phosphoribosyltransferase